MNIPLHPDVERFVREQVSPEGYASPEEVVIEALFLLWQRDHACATAEPAVPAASR